MLAKYWAVVAGRMAAKQGLPAPPWSLASQAFRSWMTLSGSGWRYRELAFLVTIILLIALTEYVFAYQNVSYGIGLALLLALGLYSLSALAPFSPGFARCIDSLTLVPLYILFTASLPWFFLDQQVLLPAVYSIILALCLWHLQSRGFTLSSLSDLGLRADGLGKYLALGILLGAPLGMIEYFVLLPAPASAHLELGNLARDILYMAAFVGLGEELLFRGILQRDMEEVFGWKSGLLLSGLLFGVMHLTWRSAPEVGFTFLAGLLLGYVYFRTRSLVGPIAIHAVNNVMLVSIMPYLFVR